MARQTRHSQSSSLWAPALAAWLSAAGLACGSSEDSRSAAPQTEGPGTPSADVNTADPAAPKTPDAPAAAPAPAVTSDGSEGQSPDDIAPIVPSEMPSASSGEPLPTPATPAPPAGSVENSGAECAAPALPPFAQLAAIPALPDPFERAAGGRITRRDEWACRRAEIGAQLQEYELGPKPPRPSVVESRFEEGQLTLSVGEPGNTIDLSAAITRPAGAAAGPVPALIAIDSNSLDASVFAERGIATITFRTSQIAPQFPSYGDGPFWQLHGADHPAGAMMAWAWGVSRIIDALEQTPEANVDLSHLAVTGCSYAGKIALFSGAFDERIGLTIAQESGGGGSASWRISEAQTAAILAQNPAATQGEQVESLPNAQGVAWYRQSLRQFNAAPERLPYDHHLLMGMVAPRALFVVDNSSMVYLGDESSFTDSVAAHEIWSGLGVPERMGASQVGGHAHCAFPASQRAELAAFVDKFMLDDAAADTNVLRSDRITPDRARWIPWTTPALE